VSRGHRTFDGAFPLPKGDERVLVRNPCGKGAPTPRFGKAVEDALRQGLGIEFYDMEGGDVVVAFRLVLRSGAIRIVNRAGHHRGTFASGSAAIAHGWEQHARRRDRGRSSRKTTVTC
jgi:hypothetical protein